MINAHPKKPLTAETAGRDEERRAGGGGGMYQKLSAMLDTNESEGVVNK